MNILLWHQQEPKGVKGDLRGSWGNLWVEGDLAWGGQGPKKGPDGVEKGPDGVEKGPNGVEKGPEGA